VERRSIGDIVIVVDISGSIGTKALEQFSGEINAIANEAQPESIHAIYRDAAVQSEDEFALQRQSSCHQGRRRNRFRAALQVSGGERHRAEEPHLPHGSLLQLISSDNRLSGALGYKTLKRRLAFGETLRVRIVD
jgi:hypothetical protein